MGRVSASTAQEEAMTAAMVAAAYTGHAEVVLDEVEARLRAITDAVEGGLLASLHSVAAAKELRDQAEALRTYARRAMKGLLVQNRCAYIKLRAEARAGELLAELHRE